MFPELHGEAGGRGALGPLETRGVDPGSGLEEQQDLVLGLLESDQIGLVIDVVDLIDPHPDEGLQLLQGADQVQRREAGLHFQPIHTESQ